MQCLNRKCICCCWGTQSCTTLYHPYGPQHARLPYSSPSTGGCSNSCPSSQWCHPIILSSTIPFFCPQSFPASGSFPMSQLFTSGGWIIGASASVLPTNIHDWVHLWLTGLSSLRSKGLSRVFSSTTVQKHQFFDTQPSLHLDPHNDNGYWKNHSLD